MQIKNHLQTMLLTPADTVIDMGKAALKKLALFCLQNVIINRKTDMIGSPSGDGLNILLRDKGAVMLLVVMISALG